MKQKTPHLLKHIWWVALFNILCYTGYEKGLALMRQESEILTEKLDDLHRQKAVAVSVNQDLQLQMESRDDPEWIELTLKRVLGMVPKGETKVYFEPQEPWQ